MTLQRTLNLLVLISLLSSIAVGSPLLFKFSKKIESREYVELGSFDASKLRQIRIGLQILTSKPPTTKEDAERQLAIARAQLARATKLHQDGLISKSDFDLENERFKAAQEAAELSFTADLVGIVDGIEIPILTLDEKSLKTTILVDSPPAMLRVKVRGKGNFSFYVWGQ